MYVSVLVRRLEEGKAYDDFVRAWYPAKGIASAEALRHERIADVIESTELRGIYEAADEFDFSTDRTVVQGRPASLDP